MTTLPIQTPTSGTLSPVGKGGNGGAANEKKKVKSKLHKVRRALKTLGVNFLEFDEGGDNKNSCEKVR